MNRAIEPLREATHKAPGQPWEHHGRQPELDLDRLVWDPEYREAMRPLLKRAS